MATDGRNAGGEAVAVLAVVVAFWDRKGLEMRWKPLGPSTSQLVGKPAKVRYRADLVGLDARAKSRVLKAEKQVGALERHIGRVMDALDAAAVRKAEAAPKGKRP